MKKRMIIVAHKPYDIDLSNVVDSFDMVFRMNRMVNWGKTGIKTDLLLLDPTPAFFKLLNESYDRFHSAKQLLINQDFWNDSVKNRLLEQNIISDGQLNNPLYLSVKGYYNKTWNLKVTNGMICIQYAIDNFIKDYDIYIIGYAINDRIQELSQSYYRGHNRSKTYEFFRMRELISSGIIHNLEDDIFK